MSDETLLLLAMFALGGMAIAGVVRTLNGEPICSCACSVVKNGWS